MADQWILVPNWERFQHYGMARRPIWIKNYNALLRKAEYRDLTLSDRGLLHGIWLAYADAEGRLRRQDLMPLFLDAENANRTPDGLRMFAKRSVTRLNQAGFVDFSASRPLLLDLKEPKDTVTPERNPNGTSRERQIANVSKLIANGVIHDEVDLTAELRDYGIDGELAATLRQQLASRRGSGLEL